MSVAVVGAVAVGGVGYLAYEEWLAHVNRVHSEETAAEFLALVQPDWEMHPEYIANYAHGGKYHKHRDDEN
ncbi:hypothetical protein HK100_005800 [Physocladia obscura]|uniref:Uncharacterized protein n=1 Tax=Physocladia obscura TaxID=109957 RepID=A0AAD5SS30_9FUNG|nr:hypothetical protein HK100_005800 [Physocladia obscura]